jgi:cytochrome c peroxidase
MGTQAPALKSIGFFSAIGLSLMVMAGCTYGRGYYGFHWSYCKFFGYPEWLGCIAPPPADSNSILPNAPYPPGNPRSAEKEELGKLLFFDERLSSTGTVSCASCHAPDGRFADPPHRLSTGINGQIGRRNAPTVLNTAFHRFLFWDGRARSLEEQAVGPIENEKEMGPGGNLGQAVERLNADPSVRARFQKAFGSPQVTAEGVAMALATFERVLISRDTAFARWVEEREPMPSWSAERGWKLFHGKASCSICHAPPMYTNHDFHNIGIGRHHQDEADMGRYEHLSSPVSGKPVDPQEAARSKCAFKTPSLLNVADTAPYMHNGTLKTLEDVVSFYARFDPSAEYARSNPRADDPKCGELDQSIEAIRGMLTPDEQMDLVEFLRSLSPDASVYREFLKSLNLPADQLNVMDATPTR